MPQTMLGWLRPVADKYGMIMLVLNPYSPVRLDSVSARRESRGEEVRLDPRRLDTALTQVFQQAAVDPDRIALVGYLSDPRGEGPKVVRDAWLVAVQNLDVFSRIVLSAAVTPDLPLPVAAPAAVAAVSNGPPRFLLAAEVPNDDAPISFGFAEALRQRGYPAELLLSLKSGGRGVWEELDYVGQWLRDSWATPNAAAPPAAGVGEADSLVRALPLLTTEAIGKLAQFWVSFRQEPDSIWRLGRRAHLWTVTLPIGSGAARPRTRLTDMVALAAQYPSVATKLQAAGLTAAEHDAYRLALVSARVMRAFGDSAATLVAPTSVLAQNVAFLNAQPESQDKGVSLVPGLSIIPAGQSRYEGDKLNPDGLRPAEDNWLPSGMWQTP